jgi:Ca-activated chloride channel family protein
VSFGRPEFLWLVLPLLALLPWFLRDRRLRARFWHKLDQRGRALGLRSGSILTAAIFLVLALAQPRFGPDLGPPLPPGHDVVLQIDVSRSMAAEDAVPNRLAVAVEAAESLVNALARDPANRAGIVAFAGRGVLRYPLTENLGAVVDVLKGLRVGLVQPGGTDLAAGLEAAIEAFGDEEHADGRSIVIFSDGEDLVDRWRSRLDRLVSAGIIVHVVAIGDAEQGHLVPTGIPEQPLTYQGHKVLSRREDTTLEAIAVQTEGAVLKLGLAPADLGTLYRGRIAPVARKKREAKRIPEHPERFPIFLAAAMGFALAGCWPGGRLGPWRWAWSRIAVTLLLAVLAAASLGAGQGAGGNHPDLQQTGPEPAAKPSPPGPAPGARAAQLVARGELDYASDHFTEALEAFEAAIAAAPDQPVPRYNAAAALFQLERYQEAQERYREARQRAAAGLGTKIDYALGNTALALGDIAAAVGHYDDCLASVVPGAGLDAVRKDAAINRQFALEQAAPSVAPQGETDRDQDKTRQRSRPPGTRKQRDGGNDSETDDATASPEPERSNAPSGGENRPPTRGRRTGGGGGASRSASESRGVSPDDRLDDALEQVREAQNRRLPEENPSEPSPDNRKDW